MTVALEDVKWLLVDLDEAMVRAWGEVFADCAQVEIRCASIVAQHASAIVSPANSFGFMDGGLDLVLSQFFGWDLEKRLRKLLLAEHDGELPVGQAVIVPTKHAQVPWLISAPTMRVPMRVDNTAHAYLAFRAIIRAVQRHNSAGVEAPITTVVCSGLGTGVGVMPPSRCAKQMRRAFDICIGGDLLRKGGLAAAVRNHMDLIDYEMK